MASQPIDPDIYTKMTNLTTNYHRDVYPAISPTNPRNSAAGKVVLITGASRGLGLSIAPAWAAAGAAGIVVTSRRLEDLSAVIEKVNSVSGGKTEILAIAAEISKSDDVKNVFLKARERFGRMDVVIANAGISAQGLSMPKLGELDQDVWWSDMEVNVRGVYLTAHHWINIFGPKGMFLTMTSGAAVLVIPGTSSYGLAKHACMKIVEYLDAEHPDIRAFSLNPGITDKPDGWDQFKPYAHDTPELVGAFTVWLATPAADAVKGGYVGVNWDVEELEEHGKEIVDKGLLKPQFLNGVLGPEGYAWGK